VAASGTGPLGALMRHRPATGLASLTGSVTGRGKVIHPSASSSASDHTEPLSLASASVASRAALPLCFSQVSHENKPIRTQAAREAKGDAADEAEVARSLRKWNRATVCLALACVVAFISTVPFSYGHSLHRYSDAIGKKILFLSGALCLAVVYAAAMTFNMWKYLRGVKKINKEFANADNADK
jgi:hypothetical protein